MTQETIDATSVGDISWEIEYVTPAMARDWLENHNPNNRAVSASTVALYARQMRQGKWALNGEALQFNTRGEMMNGQHRMHAVVEADVGVPMMVVRGLPPEVRDTLDQHRKRTAGNVLGMHGYQNANALAGIARVVSRWDDGIRSPQVLGGGHLMLTPTEVLEYIQKEPLCVEAAAASRRQEAEKLAVARVFGTIWVLTHRAASDHAEEFFLRLVTGEMLESGNPILTLRRNWSNLTSLGNARREKRSGSTYLGLNAGLRCWNAWVRGEKLQKISWKNPNLPEVLKPR